MLEFRLAVRTPFKISEEYIQKRLYEYVKEFNFKKFSKLFQIEFFWTEGCPNIFEIETDISFSGYNHAGPEFYLTLGKFQIEAHLQDSRIWDDEKSCWLE